MNMQAASLAVKQVEQLSSSTESPLLTACTLSKRYAGQDLIFENVSLSVPKGQVVSIIGPNGAGKSTLLRCCVRLVEPDAGEVFLGEHNITRLSNAQLMKERVNVGFVFQKHQLVRRMSVLTNVLHGALGHHRGPRLWCQTLAKREHREAAFHCLEQVGLQDLALRRADHLSGGQSQRVAIARALMQRSKLIFADEPTASLDPQAGIEIMELLRQLSHEKGIGVLLVSHDMEHTRHYSDHIIGLREKSVRLNAPSQFCSLSELKAFFQH